MILVRTSARIKYIERRVLFKLQSNYMNAPLHNIEIDILLIPFVLFILFVLIILFIQLSTLPKT